MGTTFHQEYRAGLKQLTPQQLAECARVMGIDMDGSTLRIPFFNADFRIEPNHIVDDQGNTPTDAVGLVLCRYLLNYPEQRVVDGERVTFRELTGAGPLVSNFAANTNKIITSSYAADVASLAIRTVSLGGRAETSQSGFDLYVRFMALPRLPIWLQFNGVEGSFPAQCVLLFYQSAQDYLDMQSLFILGTYLAGRLVGSHDTGLG